MTLGVTASEGFGGDGGPIVVRPAPDAGIERRDERALRRAPVLSDEGAEGGVMPFERLFAGRDGVVPVEWRVQR